MWNRNLHYNFLQQGAGKYENGEESEVSSQGMESSQEETENLEPSRFYDEAEERHETQLNALINDYEGNGGSENVARVKAENALLPVYRKELRKVLLENLQWILAMKKDSTFKTEMESQKELKDSEGFDWLGSTEQAIDKRKFLINRFHEKQPTLQDQDWSYYEFYRVFSLDLFFLLRFDKDCKQPNFNCVLLMTSLQPFAFQIAVYFTIFVVSF